MSFATEDREKTKWMLRFGELVEFKRELGHCRVPQKSYKRNPALGEWVTTQRRMYKIGKLSPSRFEMLNELGFYWDANWAKGRKQTKDADAILGLEALNSPKAKAFVAVLDEDSGPVNAGPAQVDDLSNIMDASTQPGFVDTAVGTDSAGCSTTSPTANGIYEFSPTVVQPAYVPNVPEAAEKDTGSNDPPPTATGTSINTTPRATVCTCIAAADKVSTQGNDAKWIEMFEKLQAYKSEHGDCLVPLPYFKDPELGPWVDDQRKEVRNLFSGNRSKLKWEQFANLESIGFKFAVRGH